MEKHKSIFLLAAISCLVISTTSADITNNISIDPEIRYQRFEGFGEGTLDQFTPIYFAKYPDSELQDYLDKLYTLKDGGLGLTICRFIVPVTDAPMHTHMQPFYYLGNRSHKGFEPEDGKFDLTGHEDIMWRIKGADDRGALMWANWNSMPYWVTISGCSAGHFDGSQNNLAPEKEPRFIKYVCEALVNFKKKWDIDFEYLSVLNECEANWWAADGGFPGTAVNSYQAVSLYKELHNQLPKYNLKPKLLAYDSAFTERFSYLEVLLSSEIEPYLDTLSCHQYFTSDWAMQHWNKYAVLFNKSLWMTEWGDWTNDGYPHNRPHVQALNYANKIHEAFTKLYVNAWVIWETDFLFDMLDEGFAERESYWVIAQYSRHIRPGMQKISSADSHIDCKTTVWIQENCPEQKIVFVTFNSGKETIKINYDFSPFKKIKVEQVRQTSKEQAYDNISFSQDGAKLFNVTAGAESVTTVVANITQGKK